MSSQLLFLIPPTWHPAAASLTLSTLFFFARSLGCGRGKPSPHKPYADFTSFYPYYLTQHALPRTKLLHCIGTLCALGLCARFPYLLVALGVGALVGATAFPLLRTLDTGLPEMALTLGAYTAVGASLTGSLRTTLLLPLCAYGWAWVAHFFVERNKPATFIYPAFSLFGVRCRRRLLLFFSGAAYYCTPIY